ncbi:cytochrome P450 [Nemania abortiva]|nr:cytochrome P450 [Nemania abortiva]
MLSQLPAHPTAIGAVVVGAVLFCLLSIAGYRILLHPLSRYPGPLFARLSDAYAGFYAFRRRLHLTTFQDLQRYGPVMRHGPNKLIFNSTAALRDIYRNDEVTKADSYLVSQTAPNVFNLFNAIDTDLHRAKRKIVGAAVSDRSMHAFEPTLRSQVDIFLKQLLACQSDVVNITDRAKWLGLDIVGHLSFGYDLRLQTDETNRFLVNAITLGNYRSNINMQFPFIHKIHLLDAVGRFLYPSWDQFTSLLQTMISTRLAQEKDAHRDFYAHVSDALDAEPEEAKHLDLWTEAMFFTIAGGDTTAAAISGTFFYLSRNPDCYARLAREIRSSFKSGSEIRSGPTLSNCHYLRACIDESLRMSPPGPSTPWRQLSPASKAGAFAVDGHVVPKGVSVGVNIYSLHHNEKYFPESFKYVPDRWLPLYHSPDTLDNAAGADKRAMRDAFCPFSTGARSCAGKSMAYLEISLTLAKTLWYFDFKPALGVLGQVGAGRKGAESGRERPEEYQLYDTFSSIHDGPCLVFAPRGDFCWSDFGLQKQEFAHSD